MHFLSYWGGESAGFYTLALIEHSSNITQSNISFSPLSCQMHMWISKPYVQGDRVSYIMHLLICIRTSSANLLSRNLQRDKSKKSPSSLSTIFALQLVWRKSHLNRMIIFDLSSPEGLSVNDDISKEYDTMAYDTLQHAINLLAQAGKWVILTKRDLKSAFRHIPINSCDHWFLLFEWQGKFYVYISPIQLPGYTSHIQLC